MTRIFQPTRENLHPNIIKVLEKNYEWQHVHGYGTGFIVDEILKITLGIQVGAFTILIQDGSERHHGNMATMVFNKEGILIDVRVYFNPVENSKPPKKTFIGAPIINGSKPMKLKPSRRKDTPVDYSE